ncbi:MAG: exodeoxyribonuclease III [Syntrophales bacterium]|nr:exodeoxyribonuclease III [Syntrophales bacterium]
MAELVIGTFNVNSLRSRLPVIRAWMETARPHILCMQETKVNDGSFPQEAFAGWGYHVVFRGDKQYNGVATASLSPPDFTDRGFDDGGPPDEDRLLRTDFGEVVVLNVYVPQGRETGTPHFAYKLQWFRRLIAYLERHFTPRDLIVLCGDLNVAREPIDVHDPKRLLGHVDFNPDVWTAFDELLAWGFVDLFRKHHPGETGHFSFFDYRVPKSVERGLGWRVDHILATRPLAAQSVECWIDKTPRLMAKPSDHTVVAAKFVIP